MKGLCEKQFDDVLHFSRSSSSGDSVSVQQFIKALTENTNNITKSYEQKMKKLNLGKLSFLEERSLLSKETLDTSVPCF